MLQEANAMDMPMRLGGKRACFLRRVSAPAGFPAPVDVLTRSLPAAQ
ncbi:MAG: hypothetical protein JSU08_12085 [Acidobacteria bacterium]|nr:hypothetical protein [Acidobacteriota bacterium]